MSLSLAITVTHANAVPLPIVIGGAGLAVGGLVWAISSAMGVDLALDNYTSQTIGQAFDPWYNIQSTLTSSDFTLIKGLRSGYDALKLSVTAYNAIKQAAINLIDDENIQDNSTGTINDVYDGIVLNYDYSLPWGTTRQLTEDISIESQLLNTTYIQSVIYDDRRVQIDSTLAKNIGQYPNPRIVFEISSNILRARWRGGNYDSGAYNILTSPSQNPTIDYVSGTVDTTFGQSALDNVTVIFPQTVLPSTATLDEILEAINELALDDSQDVTVEIDESPSPPVPVPTTPLGEVPYDEWIDTFGQSVYSKLDEQTDALDTYGQGAIEAIEGVTEAVDTVGQDIEESIEAVDTNIQTGNGILSGIRSLAQSAVNSLASIAENVGELVEEIVLGTETLISGILNQIPSAFGVIFGPIKQASTIWHYVVEWIQSIGAPFQFIWSMASGTSYYVILPVYASLAAAVVLAFFKRFGR